MDTAAQGPVDPAGVSAAGSVVAPHSAYRRLAGTLVGRYWQESIPDAGTEGELFPEAFQAVRATSRALPKRSGNLAFTIETAVVDGRSVRCLTVAETGGRPRVLAGPVHPRAGVGVGREGWAVGPPDGRGKPRWIAICDTSASGSDGDSRIHIRSAEDGALVEELPSNVHCMAFVGPDSLVYERIDPRPSGGYDDTVYRHWIGSGRPDERIDLGRAFDGEVPHEMAASPDGAWYVVAECVSPWGIGNRVWLVEAATGQVTRVNRNRRKLSEARFDTDGSLLLLDEGREGYGVLDRVDPKSGRRSTLVPEESGAQIVGYTQVTVHDKQLIAVSRVRSGLLPEITLVDPAGEELPRRIPLPGRPVYAGMSNRQVGVLGTVDALSTDADGALAFRFSSFDPVSAGYRVDLTRGLEPELSSGSDAPTARHLDMPPLVARLHHATSRDKAQVPFITAEAAGLSGEAMAVLWVYGGFGFRNRVAADSTAGRQMAVALASGGRAVIPALRGTSGNGRRWFLAGHRRKHGKNTDDARAVEEALGNSDWRQRERSPWSPDPPA